MTIKYLDAKRIRGSSAQAKTPTYETDFTTSANWVQGDTDDIEIANYQIEFAARQVAGMKHVYYDLGSSVVSGTAWVLRAKVVISTLTASGGIGTNWFIGLRSATSGTGDYVGIRYRTQASPNNNAWFKTAVDESEFLTGGGTQTAIVTPTTKTYYMEMKRLDADDVTLTLYNNSDYTGVYQATVTNTNASAMDDLRYLDITINGYAGGAWASQVAGTVDDIKFYNDVTTASGTPTYETTFSATSDLPDNTLFDETDTHSSYWLQTVDSVLGWYPTYHTNFSSNAGWSANDTHVFIDTTNNMLEFELDDNSTDEFLNYDMGAGNISNDKWILRFELVFNTWNLNGVNVDNNFFIGCFDNASPTGAVPSGDALIWGQFVRDSFDTKLRSINGGSETDTADAGNPFSSSSVTIGTTYYCEVKRVSATSLTFKAFTGSFSGTQVGSTVTRATTSGVTDLRYLTIFLHSDGTVSGNGWSGYLKNLQFFNGVSSV